MRSGLAVSGVVRADWPGWYQPSAWPSQVATNEPMMPRIAVMMKPPGSLPGIRNFAMMPTTRPIRNVMMMP